IRKIIAQLDDLNARGIPAKATWDTENGYSLEEILPTHAPDIIAGMQRRVRENGDENIIMGYNNGALAAMTFDELKASIDWAVSNEKGSGLKDLFGECAMIVRPQEVMFSPPQVADYKKLGVQALCLYHSCVPFDAFATITPQLSDAHKFNPVTYTYDGESITVMPTISNADLLDAGCLRALVKDLRAKQERGEINHDVFIFTNMDADAPFWEPLNLPWPLRNLPGTHGIRGLVEEVADLDYVVFNTPGGYLKDHPPLGEVTFGHDTADGNYTGYASWSEKPFNRFVWTRIERARALARSQGKDWDSAGFNERVMLLSTTHFGLSSPVLNIDRERRALALSRDMLQKELDAQPQVSKITAVQSGDASELLSVELCFAPGWLRKIETLNIQAEGLEHFGGIALRHHDDKSVAAAFVLCKFTQPVQQAELDITNDAKVTLAAAPSRLQAGGLQFNTSAQGEMLSVKYNGQTIAGKDFFASFLTYNGQDYPFVPKKRSALPLAGQLQGMRLQGEINLPEQLRPGDYTLDFFTMPGCNGVMLHCKVSYPYTPERHAISTTTSALGRYYDIAWQQAVPLQLTPKLSGELHVVKRNFDCKVSDFPVASFRESLPENENLASFNHQLSGGFVGLSNGDVGLLVANARQLSGSMAHCPMRLQRENEQDTVKLAPFGTYHGPQRKHPSRGGGSLMDAYTIVAPQSRSLAPAYNGVQESAVMGLFAYDGLRPQGEQLAEVCAIADGAVLHVPADSPVFPRPAEEDYVAFAPAQEHKAKKPKSVIFSGALPSPGRMARVGLRALRNIKRAQRRAK
ncbi:MAG: hypothetical protein FWE40_04635, partial [Oscillospiraceae bacterium]|nr:hypothetical protein [Oscillospiraceae bacterium]